MGPLMLPTKFIVRSTGYKCNLSYRTPLTELRSFERRFSIEINNWKAHDTTDLFTQGQRYPLLARKNVESKIKRYLKERRLEEIRQLWKLTEDLGWSLSNNIYTGILKVCNNSNEKHAFELAIKVFLSAMAHHNTETHLVSAFTQKDHNALGRYVLRCFSKCDKFIDLFTLTFIWENHISTHVNDSKIDLEYQAAYIHVLLNCGLEQMAFEHFNKLQDNFSVNERDSDALNSKVDMLLILPTKRILNALFEVHDCENLATLLEFVDISHTFNRRFEITPEEWFKYLSIGLESNNFRLVKTIYSAFIMKGFPGAALGSEDVLFRNLENINPVFKFINDDTILKILHTLSSNGDIDSTIALIESHFIHKRLVGEKSLSKELCIRIIESYCYHTTKMSPEDEEYGIINEELKDESVKIILDVINSLKKSLMNNKISYKDITEAMSFKFANFLVNDKNIKNDRIKRLNIEHLVNSFEREESGSSTLPRKLSNRNVEISTFGNVLANLDVMSYFIAVHIKNLQEKERDVEIFQLFINCILNHVNVYQNFSGIVKVFLSLHQENSNFFDEWLDTDSINIVMNSLANSGGAKLSAHYMFGYLKSKNELSRHSYRCLVSASLRGNIHNLQFYMYHYLLDYKGMVDSKMKELLSSIPEDVVNSNEGTEKMIGLCYFMNEQNQVEGKFVEKFWDTHNLSKEHAVNKERITVENKRPYSYEIDERDFKYLKYVVSYV